MATILYTDIYNKYPELLPPVAGYICEVLSPKTTTVWTHGVATTEFEERFIGVYKDEPMRLPEGLYHILSIGKSKDEPLVWCHYLFIVDGEGESYFVAEYINCHDSSWVDTAQPVVEKYFNKETLSPIQITAIPRPKNIQSVVKK